MLAVAREAVHAKPSDVLKEQSLGSHVVDLLDCPCEQITLVIRPQLLTRDAERRARYASGEQGYSLVVCVLPDFGICDVSTLGDRFRQQATAALWVLGQCVCRVVGQLDCQSKLASR